MMRHEHDGSMTVAGLAAGTLAVGIPVYVEPVTAAGIWVLTSLLIRCLWR